MNFKNFYQVLAIILFIIGLLFSYLVAEFDDAPGFIFFGTAVSALLCSILFGFGTLIDMTNKNNEILNHIYKEIKNK
jgi:uncharacterized protein YacL